MLLCLFSGPHASVPEGGDGSWAARKGGVEPQQENPLEAVSRELVEETNLVAGDQRTHVGRQQVGWCLRWPSVEGTVTGRDPWVRSGPADQHAGLTPPDQVGQMKPSPWVQLGLTQPRRSAVGARHLELQLSPWFDGRIPQVRLHSISHDGRRIGR